MQFLEKSIKRLIGDTGAVAGFRKYFANTSWLLASRLLQMLLSIVVGAWVARYLGPDRYGVYAYVLSFVALFAALGHLGIGSILVKAIVGEEDSEERIMGSAVGLQVMGATLALFVLLVVSSLTESDELTRLGIALVGFPLILRASHILIHQFQARVLNRYTAIAHIVSLLLSAGMKVWFIYTKAPLENFFWVVGFDVVVFGLGLMIGYHLSGRKLQSWRFDLKLAGSLLKRSLPLFFTMVILTFYMQIDQVMIHKLLSEKHTGWYAAAVKLSVAWYAVPWIITTSLFPAILRSLKTDPVLFGKRVRKLYQLLIVLALLVIVPTYFLAPWVIKLLFGEAFAPAAGVLTIHILASLFVFMGYLGDKWLVGYELQRFSMFNTALGAILNVIANLIMIPKFGIVGAAWATLIAQFTSYHLSLLFWKPTRPLFWLQMQAVKDVLTFQLFKRKLAFDKLANALFDCCS